MTGLDQVLRESMTDIATEVTPAEFLPRAKATSRRLRNRRRRVTAGSLAMLAIAGGGMAAALPRITRSDRLTAPPAVLVVDGLPEGTPKRIAMLLTFDGRGFGNTPPLYVALDAETRRFVRLPPKSAEPGEFATISESSADGKAIVSVSDKAATVLTLADMRSTKVEFEPCPGSPISYGRNFKLSPDGTRYAVVRSCDADGQIQIYDLASRNPVGTPFRQSADAAAFDMQWSPDGTRFATSNRISTAIVDVASGAVIQSFPTSAFVGKWSADSRSLLAWRGTDASIRPVVVDLSSGRTREIPLLAGDLFPLGWDTTERLVWGRLNDQLGRPAALVTANLDGSNVRDWLHIKGDHSLDQVQWTTDMSR